MTEYVGTFKRGSFASSTYSRESHHAMHASSESNSITAVRLVARSLALKDPVVVVQGDESSAIGLKDGKTLPYWR